jgi:hypothetical protein
VDSVPIQPNKYIEKFWVYSGDGRETALTTLLGRSQDSPCLLSNGYERLFQRANRLELVGGVKIALLPLPHTPLRSD